MDSDEDDRDEEGQQYLEHLTKRVRCVNNIDMNPSCMSGQINLLIIKHVSFILECTECQGQVKYGNSIIFGGWL